MIDASLLNTMLISSLTSVNLLIPMNEDTSNGLPSTFVPGRNILFLTLVAIYAYQAEASMVITVVCETYFTGYPDCRFNFIKSLNTVVNIGMASQLMQLDKAENWAMADYYHQLDRVLYGTLTCYHSIKDDGCRQCVACHLRTHWLEVYLSHPQDVMVSLKAKTRLR